MSRVFMLRVAFWMEIFDGTFSWLSRPWPGCYMLKVKRAQEECWSGEMGAQCISAEIGALTDSPNLK